MKNLRLAKPLPKIKLFRKVNEVVEASKGRYLINVFKEGFTSDVFTKENYFLFVKVLNNKVVAFIETNQNDKVVSYSGTTKRVEMIKKQYDFIK